MNFLVFFSVFVLVLLFFFFPASKTILGGIGMFYFGMMFVERGVKGFSGGVLETFLKKTTNNLASAMLTGFVATALVQSSTLVSLISISFISAGLLKLSGAIAIVFGSNLGTTVTSWLVAVFGLKLKISSYALSLGAFGAVFMIFGRQSLKYAAYVLFGIGLLLLAVNFIQEGFNAFKADIDFSKYAMTGFAGLILYTFLGIVVTVIVQSSLGTMVLILSALMAGQISYENSLALAIGANVGITLTVLLGGLSSNADGKRLAYAHLIFNALTAAVAIVFIEQIAFLVEYLSGVFHITDGILRLTLFHSIFNVLGILLMTPLIPRLEAMLKKRVKDTKLDKAHPAFINLQLTQNSKAFLTALHLELEALFKNVYFVLAKILGFSKADINSGLELDLSRKISNIDPQEYYKLRVKPILDAILELSTTAQVNMNEDEIKETFRLKNTSRHIAEVLKDAAGLYPNLKKYAASPNLDLRHQYGVLRKTLGEMIKSVNGVHTGTDAAALIDGFVLLKERLAKNDDEILVAVDRLIRDHKIMPSFGSSLMNDSNYVYSISVKLILIVESLYVFGNENAKQIYQDSQDLSKD
ncbi:MAG: Na/Pi cotransporter family protein [Helicobacteraceae bacterium]